MKYQIDYVHNDGYRGESKQVKFFNEIDDNAAIQEYQKFQKECEHLGGLVSWDECRGLARINPDGTTTKII